MGETCWGCLHWAVIYSTPSLFLLPGAPQIRALFRICGICSRLTPSPALL